ncbi:MAG: hypothetical protein ABIT37_20160 [Luteolibacter sp.]
MQPTAKPDPLAELTASIHLQRDLANQARAAFEAAIPILVCAIRHHSGQSGKVERILWSAWNGELSEVLAGLDSQLAQAVIAMVAARAHLSGDADGMLHKIITETRSQPPGSTAP